MGKSKRKKGHTASHMGRKKGRNKNKGFKRHLATKVRPKDIDQIQQELKDRDSAAPKKPDTFGNFRGGKWGEYDEDLPGGGLFYCPETDRHFQVRRNTLQWFRFTCLCV